MTYNLTNLTAAGTFPEIIKAGNELTQGAMVYVILSVVFIISMFSAHSVASMKDSFGAAALLTAIVGIVFYAAQLVNEQVLAYFIIFGAIGVAAMITNKTG